MSVCVSVEEEPIESESEKIFSQKVGKERKEGRFVVIVEIILEEVGMRVDDETAFVVISLCRRRSTESCLLSSIE